MTTPLHKTRFWQCGRKVLFVTRAEAQRRADEINRKEGRRVLEAYSRPCRFCNGWHLRKVKR